MRIRVIVGIVASMGLLGCSLFSRLPEGVGQSEIEVEAPLTPAETPMPDLPSGGGAACLVGTWRVTDVTAMLQSVLPSDVDSSSLQYEGTSGTMQITFGADGTGDYAVDAFTVNYSMMGMSFAFTMNGSGAFTYATAGDQVTVVTGGDSTLTGDLIIAGSSSPMGDMVVGIIRGTQQFRCEGDTLELTPDVEDASPIVYERVSP
jgi:hypothetical protein